MAQAPAGITCARAPALWPQRPQEPSLARTGVGSLTWSWTSLAVRSAVAIGAVARLMRPLPGVHWRGTSVLPSHLRHSTSTEIASGVSSKCPSLAARAILPSTAASMPSTVAFNWVAVAASQADGKKAHAKAHKGPCSPSTWRSTAWSQVASPCRWHGSFSNTSGPAAWRAWGGWLVPTDGHGQWSGLALWRQPASAGFLLPGNHPYETFANLFHICLICDFAFTKVNSSPLPRRDR